MIKVFEAFAGYGAQSIALKRANIDFEVVGISEIDKYAITAYKAIHGEVENFGDISKIDSEELPDFDLFTYSFPCTDISVSGKLEGMKDGTRSGLLWECERIIRSKRPKYLLMENVKNLVGKKFKPDFDKWCILLEKMGYENHWQVVNAKEHGVPQNRERVFMVSILGGGEYEFPEKEELKVFLKDVCDDDVDEKYYLKPSAYSSLIREIKAKYDNQEASYCIDANYYKGGNGNQYVNKSRRQLVVSCAVRGRNPENPTSRKSGLPTKQMLEVSGNEFSNCLTTAQKDSLLFVGGLGDKDWAKDGKKLSRNYPQGSRVYDSEGISTALSAQGVGGKGGHSGAYLFDSTVQKDSLIIQKPRGFNKGGVKSICSSITSNSWQENNFLLKGLVVRKLTPLECFRLMDVSDEDFYKIQKALNEKFYKGKDRSSSQLYKLAGNSIVVKPFMKIFKNMNI